MKYTPFHYKTIQEVENKEKELSVHFPLTENTADLFTPIKLFGRSVPNRLGIAPMEGNDSEESGAPSEHTVQRYLAYARGGAGVIWYEATTVVPEGRSGKHQLLLNEETMPAFKEMNERIKVAGKEANGFAPLLVLQANHSGRYSKPHGFPEPLIAYHNPYYEKNQPIADDRIVSDEYLDRLPEKFGAATKLAKEAGFDAIDIKSCHGYLFAEVASAYTRKGPHGGSFENRFRLLIDSIKAAKKYEDDQFYITCRLGIYDGFPYPYGWGSDQENRLELTEPLKLAKILKEDLGIELLNITMGNPYVDSHVTRPFDQGKYEAPEHPFVGVARMYEGTKAIKDALPDLLLMASAPSYVRQFSPNLAAGAVAGKYADFVNFGRESFADPNFPNEIRKTGTLSRRKVCITCGKCGDLIRAGFKVGCVVHNPEFKPYYAEYLKQLKNK
ncbi:hypothetical protein QUW13_00875 [Enterococcus hirae]|nr:hypothetical protein [Enterococcus hirae]